MGATLWRMTIRSIHQSHELFRCALAALSLLATSNAPPPFFPLSTRQSLSGLPSLVRVRQPSSCSSLLSMLPSHPSQSRTVKATCRTQALYSPLSCFMVCSRAKWQMEWRCINGVLWLASTPSLHMPLGPLLDTGRTPCAACLGAADFYKQGSRRAGRHAAARPEAWVGFRSLSFSPDRWSAGRPWPATQCPSFLLDGVIETETVLHSTEDVGR